MNQPPLLRCLHAYNTSSLVPRPYFFLLLSLFGQNEAAKKEMGVQLTLPLFLSLFLQLLPYFILIQYFVSLNDSEKKEEAYTECMQLIVKWAWQQHFHPPVSYWKLIAMSAHSIELTIACFLQGTVKKIPRLIIEVKTVVSSSLALESGSHLAQMLVFVVQVSLGYSFVFVHVICDC